MRRESKSKVIELESEALKPNGFSVWLKATYRFHTFAYRDPRSAFSTAPGLPVISPTTLILGIVSALFSIGKDNEAKQFLNLADQCTVRIDPPNGAVFFRAFHQLRRYETDKHDKGNPKVGLTNINQGTREYALLDGSLTVYISVPYQLKDSVVIALTHIDHLGTHDSLCSLDGNVEECPEPDHVLYLEPEKWQNQIPNEEKVTVVTLSVFCKPPAPTVGNHWWLSGGDNTELKPYLIKGSFEGTTRGKIYRKEVSSSP